VKGRCGGLVEHVLDQALLVAVERDDADRLRCRNSKANSGRRFAGAGFCHFRSCLMRRQRVTSGRSGLLMQLATPHQAAGDVGCLQ
jgi:hypothetical protein